MDATEYVAIGRIHHCELEIVRCVGAYDNDEPVVAKPGERVRAAAVRRQFHIA